MNQRNKLYLILWLACVAGYGRLFYAHTHTAETVGVCMFKQVTHIPCPSCGTTRALIAILHGDYSEALRLNPFGYLVGAIMVLFPLWMIWDQARAKITLYAAYRQFEQKVKQPRFAIPLVVLLVINWIWTITKGL